MLIEVGGRLERRPERTRSAALRRQRHRHRHPPETSATRCSSSSPRPTPRPPASYGGTGLGLAIRRQLVELMGGAIGVEQRARRRARTFWFTLPAPVGDPAAAPAPPASAGGARVLVVDDNGTNRRGAHREQFSTLGAAADAWPPGRRPSSSCAPRRERRSIRGGARPAIMPLRMRRRSTSPQRIRAIPRFTDLPLVMMTASSTSAGRPAARPGFAPGTCRSRCAVTACTRPSSGAAPTARRRRPRRCDLRLRGARAVVLAPAGAGSPGSPRGGPPDPGGGGQQRQPEGGGRGMLARLGYQVDRGRQWHGSASSLVSPAQYAVVFMDCLMPEMDGYEATAAIRRAVAPGERLRRSWP